MLYLSLLSALMTSTSCIPFYFADFQTECLLLSQTRDSTGLDTNDTSMYFESATVALETFVIMVNPSRQPAPTKTLQPFRATVKPAGADFSAPRGGFLQHFFHTKQGEFFTTSGNENLPKC